MLALLLSLTSMSTMSRSIANPSPRRRWPDERGRFALLTADERRERERAELEAKREEAIERLREAEAVLHSARTASDLSVPELLNEGKGTLGSRLRRARIASGLAVQWIAMGHNVPDDERDEVLEYIEAALGKLTVIECFVRGESEDNDE
jgi:hypothetical protein